MKRGLVQWACMFFGASMLAIAGCASADAGSDDAQVVPDDTAQASPDVGAANIDESVHPEDEALAFAFDESEQSLQQGPASVTVPGLTILKGGLSGVYLSYPDWGLHVGTGPRSWSRYVTFPVGAFSSPPAVSASLYSFWAQSHTNPTYVHVAAEDVTISGFNLKFSTSSTVVLYGAAAQWIAFGPN